MNSEASSELGCLGGLPEKFLSMPFSHYSFRVQRRSQVSKFSHLFMCAFLLFELGNKKLSGRTLSKRHRYSLLVGSFSHPVVHFTSTVACFCLISHNAFSAQVFVAGYFCYSVSSLSKLFCHPIFHGKPSGRGQVGCHSLMSLAKSIRFPHGECCKQTSQSIWTFSTGYPDKYSIFAFRSLFTSTWETSRWSFHFLTETSLCFMSHFNSLPSHVRLLLIVTSFCYVLRNRT